MLNDLIKEYIRVRASHAMAGGNGTQEIVKVLHDVENYLSVNGWKCNPSLIENNTWAMCMFYEMLSYKIGGDTPAMMCYYFSTLVAQDSNLPEDTRHEGNKYRAFIIFKSIGKWDGIISEARLAPVAEYKGHLDESSFFDILLLGDVYKAWNVDSNSRMLANLKEQALTVASSHPSITRQQAMIESELAHAALFKVIELLIKKY
jgi:hypothetical protein